MGWIKNTGLIALGGVIGYAIHEIVEKKAVRDALKKKFDDIDKEAETKKEDKKKTTSSEDNADKK